MLRIFDVEIEAVFGIKAELECTAIEECLDTKVECFF